MVVWMAIERKKVQTNEVFNEVKTELKIIIIKVFVNNNNKKSPKMQRL